MKLWSDVNFLLIEQDVLRTRRVIVVQEKASFFACIHSEGLGKLAMSVLGQEGAEVKITKVVKKLRFHYHTTQPSGVKIK